MSMGQAQAETGCKAWRFDRRAHDVQFTRGGQRGDLSFDERLARAVGIRSGFWTLLPARARAALSGRHDAGVGTARTAPGLTKAPGAQRSTGAFRQLSLFKCRLTSMHGSV
jgi:hypothetical protein